MFTATGAFAQAEVVSSVKEAIRAGSSKECARFLNQNVDVTLDGEMNSYSKTQAEYILRDFFKNNPPASFDIVHQGSSKGGLRFAIGQYLSNDNTFRVFMRIKKVNNLYLIHEISFIKE